MTSLSLREQRLIALLILLLLIAGIWNFVMAPVLDGFARRSAQRVELRASIERNERLISRIPQLRRQIEMERPDAARFTLVGMSRDSAAEALRQRLQRNFEAAGANLTAVGDSDVQSRWVGASAEGTVTLNQLMRILEELQNEQPYLLVTGLTVVADRAFQYGKLDVMTVKIDVAIPHSKTA